MENISSSKQEEKNIRLIFILQGSVQFSSVTQSCPTLCDPMNRSTPGRPVHHQLPEFTQTHVHGVGDAIQPSHPLSSPSPPAPNPSPASGSFPMSQLFAWGGQSTGVSASASVLPINTQDWSPLVSGKLQNYNKLGLPTLRKKKKLLRIEKKISWEQIF